MAAQGGRLACHANAPLSPSIRMGLFEGRAARLVLRQHRHTAHFERTAADPRPRNPLLSREPALPVVGDDPLGGGPRLGPQMAAPHLAPTQALELELDWGA